MLIVDGILSKIVEFSRLAILIFAIAAVRPTLAQTSALFYRTDYMLGYTPLSGTTGLVVADFNNDGKRDFAIGAGYGINVALGNGDGTFQPFQSFIPTVSGVNPTAALSSAAADFDGDGNIDLVMHEGNGIVILPGKGDGTFGPSRLIMSQPVACSCLAIDLLQTADLNHDDHPDLVYLTESGASPIVASVIVLLNKGDGTFSSSTAFDLPNNEFAVGVTIADFNQDGTSDLAVIGQVLSVFAPFPPVQGHVYVALGQGDGSFSAPVAVLSLNDIPNFVAAADFNHDGSPDLVVESGVTSILLGNGDGSFHSAPTISLGGQNPGSIAIADWTGSGNPGLGIYSEITPHGIAIMAGNGDGTFYPAGTAVLPLFIGDAEQFSTADFNGDGLPDLVAPMIDAGNFGAVSVLLNSGKSPPLSFVPVSAATGTPAVAPSSIASIYAQFPFNVTQSNTVSPVPTQLAGVTVNVRDSAGAARMAPLFYVSPTQINLEIPAGAAPGAATVTVVSSGPPVVGSALIQNAVPTIFTAAPSVLPAAYAITYGADNQPQAPLSVTSCQADGCASVPIPRPTGSRVFLELFATGIRNHVAPVVVSLNGPVESLIVKPAYAGPQGQFEGLDQVNVEITNLPSLSASPDGTMYFLLLNVDGQASNVVPFVLQ